MTKFSKWVEDQGGQTALAEKLNVTPQAVGVWVRGIGRPRVAAALKIIAMAKGQLTLNDVFRDTLLPEGKKVISKRGPKHVKNR